MFLCHSYYSLRYGTQSIEQLVEQAVRLGIKTLALTDINNSTGIMDFIATCKEHHIKPVAGIEFRTNDHHLYTVLAKNNDGFREINEFLTYNNLNNLSIPKKAPHFENATTIYPLKTNPTTSPHPLIPLSADQREASIGRPTGGLRSADQREASNRPTIRRPLIGIPPSLANPIILSRYAHLLDQLVIMAPVTVGGKHTWELHKNLRAIDHNILFSRLEPHHLASADEAMKPITELFEPFRDYPEIIRNTEELFDMCTIDFDFRACKNKRTFTGNEYDDQVLLEKLALDGLSYRYGNQHVEAKNRIRHEIDIICRMGFAAYFLIAWDIVRYSMSRGFYHVGRGSGANSIVAYCLKITNVDPIELDLYFERFINPKRSSPPDFDIDYSWKERDEVLDYIFKRYGREHTALLGAMSTFKDNSIYRELGKVHGLPKKEMDLFLRHPDEAIHRNSIIEHISKIGEMMTGFPNLRTIHAGGVLISEQPITCYTALDLPPKGFPTTQWDMYVAEEIGFEKLDILSQRGIGHIYEAAQLVKERHNITLDVHDVKRFKQDARVKNLLQKAHTIGCFYVESPAMRGLLKKLHCDNYLTLVAASSIIRPGVARSGMMKEYIQRFHNPQKISYLHPVMKEQLQETYGVMVYQEDVLKICHHFAGLDLSESDVIRRAMSGKYRSKKELQRIIDKFFSNWKKFGFPDAVTKEVWRQNESFAGYSFSKAHSASYAVESYQSLYLKAHFPLEFMVGVVNNFGGFYPSWVYLNEARNLGATLHPPCVNNSNYMTCLRGEKEIYIGFIHIANLESHIGPAIEAAHPFSSLSDFISRVSITLDQLLILIRAGAFRFTGKPKAALLWEAHMIMDRRTGEPVNQWANEPVGKRTRKTSPIAHQTSLIAHRPSPITKPFTLPALEQSPLEEIYDEIELLGWPVTHTWFDLLQTGFRGEIMAQEMMQHVGRKVRMLGLLVTIKYVRTIKKEWMHFGTFIDVHGQVFDTVHFPKAVNEYPFRGDGIYLIGGKIVEEFGFPSLEVAKMAKMPLKPDPRG